jgi:hypothetical protein
MKHASTLALAFVLPVAAAAGCSASGASTDGDSGGPALLGTGAGGGAGQAGKGGKGGASGASGAPAGGKGGTAAGGTSGTGGAGAGLVATCTPAALVVTASAAPTATCTATLGGAPVTPVWSLDKGELGAIDVKTGVFTPSKKLGGTVTITAGYGMKTATAPIAVSLNVVQVGPNANDNTGMATAGGVGGVGGEGVGPIPGPAVKTALGTPPVAMGAPTWLYPYDKTVWPRGLLPPLMQWAPSASGPKTFDGISIHLETKSKSFVYDGSFGAPMGASLLHHPIPIDAWNAATESAGGPDTLTVSIVLSSGGKAYGPLTETWTVAPGRLGGSVYYNAYNTALAKNYPGGINDGGAFGAAVLSIDVGSGATGPTLVAGSTNPGDSTDVTKCRTCHSVAAGGSRLIVQHGDDYSATSAYELTAGNKEVPLASKSTFGWAALYPDGSFALTDQAPLSAGVSAGAGLYSRPDGAAIPSPGLAAVASAIATPSFSVDGSHVAFNVVTSTNPDNNKNTPGPKLVGCAFDVKTKTFSSPVTLADTTGDPQSAVPTWPAFLPTNDAVVFQKSPGIGTGALSQIFWSDLKTGKATLLGRLNGVDGGMPIIPSSMDHPDDPQRNYEPTVGPLATGGFAWVIFTSRRLYGNIATLPPGASDPRNFDLVTGVSPKKLWVAAVDLNDPPGTDPSHPAFYLPGQELHGSNSRGFWVFGPCRADGASCQTGDQCCGGFCQANGSGALVCSNKKPSCSAEQESCKTAADCCNPMDQCLNGFCAPPVVIPG